MPHLIIEYSDNLAEAIEVAGLVDRLHDVAASIEALPIGGLRTRAVSRNRYKIADGHADNGFIYVTLRIAEGRPPDVQKAMGETLFAALTQSVQGVLDRQPMSLGFEIQEIKAEKRWLQTNLREYLEKRRH